MFIEETLLVRKLASLWRDFKDWQLSLQLVDCCSRTTLRDKLACVSHHTTHKQCFLKSGECMINATIYLRIKCECIIKINPKYLHVNSSFQTNQRTSRTRKQSSGAGAFDQEKQQYYSFLGISNPFPPRTREQQSKI